MKLLRPKDSVPRGFTLKRWTQHLFDSGVVPAKRQNLRTGRMVLFYRPEDLERAAESLVQVDQEPVAEEVTPEEDTEALFTPADLAELERRREKFRSYLQVPHESQKARAQTEATAGS